MKSREVETLKIAFKVAEIAFKDSAEITIDIDTLCYYKDLGMESVIIQVEGGGRWGLCYYGRADWGLIYQREGQSARHYLMLSKKATERMLDKKTAFDSLVFKKINNLEFYVAKQGCFIYNTGKRKSA